MGNSLQDELRKAGLVTERRLREARRSRRDNRNRVHGRGQESNSEAAVAARKAAAKAERDRRLNREREEAARRKAVAAEIRQIVAEHRLPRVDGDVAYHFVEGTTIKRVYVPAPMHPRIVRGELAVVRSGRRYEVVPAAIAAKIAARDPRCVMPPNHGSSADEADEAYAAYKVPDDLMW